jgi:hypothetical protein
MKITKNTRALDAIRMSKKIIRVFEGFGLYCPMCKGVAEETIEKIAVNNGLELKKLLKELNSALE